MIRNYWPRKHQMVKGEQPMPDLAPRWFEWRCLHCSQTYGLDEWQFTEMPREMALCSNPKGKRFNINELIFPFGGIDCLRKIKI